MARSKSKQKRVKILLKKKRSAWHKRKKNSRPVMTQTVVKKVVSKKKTATPKTESEQ